MITRAAKRNKKKEFRLTVKPLVLKTLVKVKVVAVELAGLTIGSMSTLIGYSKRNTG